MIFRRINTSIHGSVHTARFNAKVHMGIVGNPGKWKYWAEAFSATDAVSLLKLCRQRADCFAKGQLRQIKIAHEKLRKSKR